MKLHMRVLADLAPGLGLIVGPVLWAGNTEIGQMLPQLSCRSGLPLAMLSSLAAAILTAIAASVSWSLAGSDTDGRLHHAPAHPPSAVFIGRLSGLNGAIFAFVLLLQAMAALVFTGCER